MAKESLSTPEKLSNDVNSVELLKYAVEQKKAEFQAIQGKITQYKTQISSLEQRLITLESEHKAKMLAEIQKFERERQAKVNDMNNRDEALRKGEADLIRRKIDIEAKETKNEEVNRLKNDLLNEKLKYENLNNEAQIKFNQANELYGHAVKKVDEAAITEKLNSEKLTEAKNILSIAEQKESVNKERELDIKKQADNLIALRKELNPKIDELKKLCSESDAKLKELSKKEQEIKDRIEEDNKLISALDEKEKRLSKKERDLATKEQELLRKDLVIKNL
jgi:chromosome segregation protein